MGSNRIKQGLASLLLAGSGLVGSGCESIEMTPAGEALGRSMLFQGAAVYSDTPQEAAGWNILAEGSRSQFQMEAAKEAAREGRTDITIKIGNNNSQNYPQSIPNFNRANFSDRFFVCNYFEDRDRKGEDGHEEINYPRDYRGIKKSLTHKEPITICANTSITDPIRLDLVLTNNSGQKITAWWESSANPNGNTFFYRFPEGKLLGDYTAKWYANGYFIGQNKFEVLLDIMGVKFGKK